MITIFTMELGKRIKKFMHEKEYTQRELAKRAGIREYVLSKYISGERSPKAEVIVSLANALEITTDKLLGRGA